MPKWSPLEPESDRRLVLGLNDGAEDVLGMLYDAYVERLYDYALCLVHEPKAAADIVHDALVDAARRAPRMRDRLGLRAWLYGAVRRRCLLATRARAVGFEEGAGPQELEGVLGRLAFHDQEVATLVYRHGVAGAELAALLGLAAHRAAVRVRQATAKAEAAVADEVTERYLTCAGVPEDLAQHVDECPECTKRKEITAEDLLTAPAAATPPSSLRLRVLHTGTDGELAGYRADIAARGGALTSDGMPRQPDVTSPITRRWLFTGGAAVGAVASALVAALFIGPVLPGSDLIFPRLTGPDTGPLEGQSGPPKHAERQSNQGGPGNRGPAPMPLPQPQGHSPSPIPGSTEIKPPQSSPQVGTLAVSQTQIQLTGWQRTAEIALTASGGPVVWTATPSSSQVQLSSTQGTLAKDAVYSLTVSLPPSLVQLPGQAQIVLTDATGRRQTVTVSWTLSLL